MAANVDDIIHPASNLVVAVAMPDRSITGKIEAAEGPIISFQETAVGSVYCARHSRPRLLQTQSARNIVTFQFLALPNCITSMANKL